MPVGFPTAPGTTTQPVVLTQTASVTSVNNIPTSPPTITPPVVITHASTATPVLDIPTLPPTLTLLVATDTPYPYTDCGWQWANQDLPDLSAQLSQAFIAAGLADVEAHAYAYGENCMGQDGKVQRFAAMETDFNVRIAVQDANDTQALGNLITQIMPVIEAVPPEQLAGPNPGRVAINFLSGTGETNLSFTRAQVRELLEQGLTGSALFDALRPPG